MIAILGFLSSSYSDTLTVLASKISISKLSVVNLSFLNFAVVLSSLSFLSTETLSVELDEESFLDSSFLSPHAPKMSVDANNSANTFFVINIFP